MIVDIITREFETNLPAFNCHDEAYDYFEERFSQFRFAGSVVIDGQFCKFYDVVYDSDLYLRFLESKVSALMDGSRLVEPTSDYLDCYQRVEIFEDGNVHIVF